MTFLLLVAALVLLALPRLLWWRGRRLHPREWVRLGVAALLVGALALELALVLLAIPTLLRAFGVPGLAATCRRLLGELAPGGVSVGWSAAMLALVLPLRAWRSWCRAGRMAAEMEIEAFLGEHSVVTGIDIAVLPTPSMLAYSIGGAHGQVVVSTGLFDALTVSEREAVLRHELAHLRNGHQRLLLVLASLEGALPLLRWSDGPLRTGLERWADEEAVGGAIEERATLCDALLRVTGLVPGEAVLAGFTSTGTVVHRVEALLAGPPAPRHVDRVAVQTAVTAATMLGVAGVAGWAAEAHMMLSAVGIC